MRKEISTILERVRPFVYPATAASIFALAFTASLFFNGQRIEYFALSLIILFLLLCAVLWRGYSRGLRIPKTPLTATLTLFWLWLAVTQLWSPVPYVSAVNFWWVGGAVLVFWLMTLLPEDNHPYPGTYVVVLGVGIVLALLSFYQQLHLVTPAQSTFLTRNSHAGLMCLIAIPTSGYFLLAYDRSHSGLWTSWILGLVLFVLYFSIALTSSRGATAGLLAGLMAVLWLTYGRTARARLAVFLGIIVLAYVAANLQPQGGIITSSGVGGEVSSEVSTRLGTLATPTKADPARLLIWQRSWQMLMDAPWWGVGLGTYWLHWPPYRHPQDISAGFYVHNDYLQIWIEAGLPGLFLLFSIYVAVMVMFIRLLRHASRSPAVCIEAAGLFGGLLAIAVHTFFDFHLYIYPIQLVMGLVLARLHALYLVHVPAGVFVIQPMQWVGRRAYRATLFLVILLPLMYFAALGGSTMLTHKARHLMAQTRWVEASETLARAAQLMPTSDFVLISHADMLRQALWHLPPGSDTERQTLYREALALLAAAERVNPLRSQLFFVRGLLYQQAPDLTGPDWADRAGRAYAIALKRNPMAFWAREAYGRLLLSQGNPKLAKDVLEGGIDYHYVDGINLNVAVVGYFELLVRVRREAGESGRAEELERRIDQIKSQPGLKPLIGSGINPGQK